MLQSNPGCVCACLCVYVPVCLCVCVSVCIISTAKTIEPILWNFPQLIFRIFAIVTFAAFEISNLMTSKRPFCTYTLRHSHGHNFDSIFFHITYSVQLGFLMFVIENQQDQSITSGRKGGPPSRKVAAFIYELGSKVPGSNPSGGEFLHFDFFWLWTS